MTEARLTLEAQPRGDAPDLVSLARRDTAAFGALYRRHYERVYRYCHRRVFLRDVAEELTADVFLKGVEKFDGFRGDDEALSVWLYRVATNCANEYLRKRRRRRALLEGLTREAPAAGVGADGASAADEVLSLKRALLHLKPAQQAVIALRFFEDMSYEEMASILGSRAATIRSQLSRALGRLRRMLEGERDVPRGHE